MERVDRRTLLERGGRIALAGTLLPSLRRAELPELADADPRLRELNRLLSGPVLSRGSSGYAAAKQVYNTRFDSSSPLAIARCTSARDVARALQWARRHRIRVAPRSGGHSYGGYSTTPGLVVDVRRLNRVHVDAAGKTATIGAGALLGDVYESLWQRRVTIPAGSCPTVGIGGLTLGGGIGFASRRFGATCDNLLAATVVTAAGEVLQCSSHDHADLFWALRGGGGGNFGVVTSFRFRVHPVDSVTTFRLTWPWSEAPAVVAAWQDWLPHTPAALFSGCGLFGFGAGSGAPRISVSGQFFGSKAALGSVLQRLVTAVPPASTSIVARTYIEAQRYWSGGCNGPARTCWSPQGFFAKSDYAHKPLSARGIAALLHGIDARGADPSAGRGYVLLDSYGGAINRVGAGATAFVHRDALFSFQYQAAWDATATAADRAGGIRWLRQFHGAMRPFVSGFAYQNYIDPDLTSWAHAYYGANYARLRQVKRKYDPGNLFHFAQSIRPA